MKNINIKKLIKESKYTYAGADLHEYNVFLAHAKAKFQRPSYLPINGTYGFEYTRSALIPNSFSRSIMVPYAMESLLSGLNVQHKRKGHYHFHKEFFLQKEMMDEHIFLNILRLDGKYTIHLNGKPIHSGSDEFNLIIDVKESAFEGLNLLDFDFEASSSSLLGITGQVYIESAKANYVIDVKIDKDIENEKVTFYIDAEKPKGTITVTSPFNYNEVKEFDSDAIDINLNDISKWSTKDPFFYQYEIVLESGDTISGYFNYMNLSIGERDNIKVLLVNNEPVSIKGVRDDSFYPDGIITMPSFSYISNLFSSLKNMGFNAINLTNRIELPFYYYCADVKGLLVSQEINESSTERILDYIEYLKQYDSVFHIVINLNKKSTSPRRIYDMFKPLLKTKFLSVYNQKSHSSFGDFNLLSMNTLDYLSKKRKTDKPFLINNLYYKNDSLSNFSDFMKNKYIKYSINDLSGFFYSTLFDEKDGIFSHSFYSGSIIKDTYAKLLK